MIIQLGSMSFEDYGIYTDLVKQNTIQCINMDDDYYEVLDEKQFFLLVLKHGLEYSVVEK